MNPIRLQRILKQYFKEAIVEGDCFLPYSKAHYFTVSVRDENAETGWNNFIKEYKDPKVKLLTNRKIGFIIFKVEEE